MTLGSPSDSFSASDSDSASDSVTASGSDYNSASDAVFLLLDVRGYMSSSSVNLLTMAWILLI